MGKERRNQKKMREIISSHLPHPRIKLASFMSNLIQQMYEKNF
jgi:hypothetical protein